MSLSFTDQFCIADPLVPGESTFGMLAFPWVAQDGSTLVMTYHDGRDASTGGDFVTRLKTSADLGVTWTPGRVVWDDGLDTGANVTVLASGDWLLASQGYVSNAPHGVYTKRSTDHGATWQPAQAVTDTAFTAGDTWTSTAPFELASALLLWPVYGSDGDSQIAKLLVSADDGVTWTVGATLLAVPGVNVNEVSLQQMPDGCIVAMVRAADMVARRVVSHDDGVTWSAPVAVFSGCNSRIDWIRLASGRCVACYRDASTSCGMVTYSDDDMATVAAPAQIDGPDKRTSYSSLAEVAPGVVFAALGEVDDTENNGRIMARYILDGDGMAPTGQTTYLDARRRAAGDGSILCWDAFRRPNNAQGLGSADSGQQWMEFGGTGSDDWKIVSNAAQNSAASIHSVTVDTGNQWGFVEADLMWLGGTSSPIGLCAKRSTSTGHAIVAKLDSGGKTLRLSYFNGSTIADLATPVAVSYPAGIWYRWRFVVKGDYARLFIDGHEAISYTLTATDHTNLDAGTRWGLWGGGSSATTYKARNVIVST